MSKQRARVLLFVYILWNYQGVAKMSPIKDFKVKYEALNKENTFSEGDTIKGTLTFTLTEPTKLKCLFVKAKGDANVHWSEGTGDKRRSHTAHRRFFKTKEYLIVENAEGKYQCVSEFYLFIDLFFPFHQVHHSTCKHLLFCSLLFDSLVITCYLEMGGFPEGDAGQ